MRRSALFIVTAVVIVALALWGYTAYRKSTTRAEIAALVTDASARLKPALAVSPGAASDFEGDARAAESGVKTLRTLDTESMLPLADAADGYLVWVREILKRRAAMQSASERTAQAFAGVTQHLQTDRGRAAWTREAVALRDALDREHRHYRIVTESYVELLESLPGTQARMAEQMKTLSLVDEKAVRDARAAALDALARTDENIRKTTQLDTYRGRRR